MSFVVDDFTAQQQRFDSFKLGGPPAPRPQSNRHSGPPAFTTSNDIPKRHSHHRRISSVSTRHESAELMGLPELPPSTSDDSLSGEKDSIRRRALWALEGKQDATYSKVEIPELPEEIDGKSGFDFPTRPSFPPGPGIANAMASKRDSFKLLSTGPSKDMLTTLVEEEEEDDECEGGLPKIRAPPVTPMTPTTPESFSFRSKMSAPPLIAARPRPTGMSLRPLSLTAEPFVPAPAGNPNPRPGLKSLSLLNSAVEEPTNVNDATTRPSPNSGGASRRPVLNLHITAEPAPITAATIATSSATPSSTSSEGNKVPFRRSSISYKTSQGTTNQAGLPTPEMTPTFSERRYSGQSIGSMSSRSSISSNMDLGAVAEEESMTSSSSTGSFSLSSSSRHRALSASEQHFLFKSHNALLARITDLERALSVRRRESFGFGGASPSSVPMDAPSRPLSVASDISSSTNEPSDEMLRLVADLKAERDELKRDVEGWRTRVGDLEKQIAVFVKRVEYERRDAWVARSKVGLLEVEKSSLTRDAERRHQSIQELEQKVHALEMENARLVAECDRLRDERGDVEDEVQRWMTECEKLRVEILEAEEAHQQFDDPLATPTPAVVQSFERHRFVPFGSSVDSQSSTTDVDDESPHLFGFSLKAVAEESELLDDDDDENGLAGYEDEDDGDMSFQGSSSSFGSLTEFPRSIDHLKAPHDVPESLITPVSPMDREAYVGSRSRDSSPLSSASSTVHTPTPSPPTELSRHTHQSHASLSKTWTFPRSVNVQQPFPQSDSIDRFFGCMDDPESDAPASPITPGEYTYERSKGLFMSGLKLGEDEEDTPFFLPRNATGTFVSSPSATSGGFLDVLVEEDEDEEQEEEQDIGSDDESDMFGEVGGIQITFTPPQAGDDDLFKYADEEDEVDDEEEDEDESLPAAFAIVHQPIVQTPPSVITPPRTVTRVPVPSAIPRATFSRSSPSPEPLPKLNSPRFNMTSPTTIYSTPPSKRGGVMPSFIPQPTATSPKPSMPSATFIRQPQRKPLTLSNNNNNNMAPRNGQAIKPQPPIISNQPMNIRPFRSDDHPTVYQTPTAQVNAHTGLDSYIPTHDGTSSHNGFQSSPIHSPSLSSIVPSSRLAFQAFTNMIPRGWSSPRPAASSGYDDDFNAAEPLDAPVVKKRGFVSKQAQLAKLKIRLQRDQTSTRNAEICWRCCDGDVVEL